MEILDKILKLFGKQLANGKKIKSVSYFGFADASPSDPLYKEAYECAKYIASKGYISVDGGGPGVMRAVTEGAQASGGKTIGVTFYPKYITNFEGRDKNNHFEKEIITKNYLERTLGLLREGDAYIIFKGGTGTVSEFGMCWGLARLYYGYHKPLILYGDYWNNIIKAFIDNMRIRPEDLKVYKVVNTPEEAYQALLEFENAIGQRMFVSGEEKDFQQ